MAFVGGAQSDLCWVSLMTSFVDVVGYLLDTTMVAINLA